MCDIGFPEGTELFGQFGGEKKEQETNPQKPQQTNK